jgi:NAD-dependent SIR2 family protein deacetylase
MWPRSDPRTIDTGASGVGREWNALADVSCPSCGSSMVRTVVPEQPHIEIERCPACEGVFFDAGELTDLRYVTLVDFIRKLRRPRQR